MTAQREQYEFWQKRLAGEVLPIDPNTPEAGFYRHKRRDGSSAPVAVWYGSDGKLRCRIGTQDVDEHAAAERWPYFSKHPVTHEAYKAKLETGEWPDQHEAVSRLSNNPPADDSFEGLQAAIDDLAREANAILKAGAAKTQAEADRASDLANKIGELWKRADEARKAEKRPHDDAAKAVQAKWQPLLMTAEIYQRVKSAVITPFLRAKEAEERAKREAAAKAGTPLPEPQRSTTKAGTRGRSVALRSVKRVEITDRDAFIAYIKEGEVMTRFLQDAAEKIVRAGVTPPGVRVTEEKVAA